MRIGLLTPSSRTFNHWNSRLGHLNLIRISTIDDLRGRTFDIIAMCHDSFSREINSECFEFMDNRNIKRISVEEIDERPIKRPEL